MLFLFIAVAFQVIAQSSKKGKADSVCLLVKKYINEKASDSLYQLTGSTFRSRVSAGAFRSTAAAWFAPLGIMEEAVFEQYAGGAGGYTSYLGINREKKLAVIYYFVQCSHCS